MDCNVVPLQVRRPLAHDLLDERHGVRRYLLFLHGKLGHREVHHSALVGAVFDAALLELLQGLFDVERDRLGLGVGHEPAPAEDLPQLAHVLHHVGGGNRDVEIQPAPLDLLDQVCVSYKRGPGLLGLFRFVALGEHEDLLLLPEHVRESHDVPDGMLALDVELHGDFHRLIELRVRKLLHQLDRLLQGEGLRLVQLLHGGAILLSMLRHAVSPPP